MRAFSIIAGLSLGTAALASNTSVDGTDGQNELGKLPCAAIASQTSAACPYEYLRKGDGTSTLRVLLPGGTVRYIYFEGTTPTGTDSTDRVLPEQLGDTLLIYIGDAERFEVPMSIFGTADQ